MDGWKLCLCTPQWSHKAMMHDSDDDDEDEDEDEEHDGQRECTRSWTDRSLIYMLAMCVCCTAPTDCR